MAGPITHLLVAEDAISQVTSYRPDLGDILPRYKPFVMLGAVSPDLPYLCVTSPRQAVWADKMHYVTTNRMAQQAVVNIGCSNLIGRPEGDAQVAWLAGFVAHCVTDATIHPLVEGIVGPYHEHKVDHQRCEMTQDSLLFTENKRCDLRNSQYVDILRHLTPETLGDHILDLWHNSLKVVYPDVRPEPRTRSWYGHYRTLLNGAIDGDFFRALSRPVSALRDVLYKSGSDIRAHEPDSAMKFYDKIPRPDRPGDESSFEALGFQMAIMNILPVWDAMMKDIQNAKDIGRDVSRGVLGLEMRNWNLDTGVDLDDPAVGPTFWPGGSS